MHIGQCQRCSTNQDSLGSAQCLQSGEQVHKAKLLAPGKWQGAPQNGVVAVKVQYPDALQTMLQDLSNVRVAASFLQVGGGKLTPYAGPGSWSDLMSRASRINLCSHLTQCY